jgi:hypothetical protein
MLSVIRTLFRDEVTGVDCMENARDAIEFVPHRTLTLNRMTHVRQVGRFLVSMVFPALYNLCAHCASTQCNESGYRQECFVDRLPPSTRGQSDSSAVMLMMSVRGRIRFNVCSRSTPDTDLHRPLLHGGWYQHTFHRL